MGSRDLDWEKLEERIKKDSKKSKKMKVSGASVKKLARIISNKGKKR